MASRFPAAKLSYLPTATKFSVALPALRALMKDTASDLKPVALHYAPNFRDDESVSDLALQLVDTVQVDFTTRSDRSGGLMAPKFKADSISRTAGLVAADAFNPSQSALARIYDGATLLGLPLSKVLATPLGPPKVVPTLGNPGARMSWQNLNVHSSGPLMADSSTQASLTVEKTSDKSEITCHLQNFQLVMPPPHPLGSSGSAQSPSPRPVSVRQRSPSRGSPSHSKMSSNSFSPCSMRSSRSCTALRSCTQRRPARRRPVPSPISGSTPRPAG